MKMCLFRVARLWAGVVCVAIADVAETCKDETCDAGQSSPFLLQATINDLKHEGGLHETVKDADDDEEEEDGEHTDDGGDEAEHYQGGKGDDVDTVDKNAKGTVTCYFTMDNVVDSVYYNGNDVTSTVQGDLNNWESRKMLTLTPIPGALLVVSGHNLEHYATNHCLCGGFALKCDNGVTSESKKMEAYGAPGPMGPSVAQGEGSTWFLPCVSTSGFYLPGHRDVGKRWGLPQGQYAAFRVELESPITGYWLKRDSVANDYPRYHLEESVTTSSGTAASTTEGSNAIKSITTSVKAGFPVKFVSVEASASATLTAEHSKSATETLTTSYSQTHKRTTNVQCQGCTARGRNSIFQWMLERDGYTIATINYRCLCGADAEKEEDTYRNFYPECPYPYCLDALCTRARCGNVVSN